MGVDGLDLRRVIEWGAPADRIVIWLLSRPVSNGFEECLGMVPLDKLSFVLKAALVLYAGEETKRGDAVEGKGKERKVAKREQARKKGEKRAKRGKGERSEERDERVQKGEKREKSEKVIGAVDPASPTSPTSPTFQRIKPMIERLGIQDFETHPLSLAHPKFAFDHRKELKALRRSLIDIPWDDVHLLFSH